MSGKLNLTETEKAIYSMAFSEIRLKKKYLSPLRPGEKDPSFEFFINNKSKRLWWHDWGSGEKGNCYDFLDKYKGEIRSRSITIKEEKEIIKEKIITTRDFSKEELIYWLRFGITGETLNHFNVKAVDEINGIKKEMTFIYYLKSNRYKIYSPLSKYKKMKFWGTMKSSDVFGIEQIDYDRKTPFIITKSLKDVILLYQMGFNSISFASESIIPKETLISTLKFKFKKIYILYDNDKQGTEASEKIAKEHGLIDIKLSVAKDISDCANKYGYLEALNHLIKQIKKA